MLVVADATPLHYLILIGEIDLLRKLYGRITIPQAVVEELSAPRSPAAVRNWIADLPSWAVARRVHSQDLLPFEFLGPGEREAISLVRDSAAGILLTDDMQARTVAESIQIRVVPTIRLMSTASDLSLVDFDDALRRLRETNFRLSRRIVERIAAFRLK